MMRELTKNILICCIICSVTMFVSSYRFVNVEVTPKWLSLMICIGFIGIVWSVFSRKISLSAKSIDTVFVKYIYGTVIIFALALSVQGIFQYFGMLMSGSNHAVTGSFDNPAGFAAALACALPLCFLFVTSKTKYLKYTAIIAAVWMAIVMFLSGSRAGMLAIAAATAVWLIAQSKIVNLKSKTILLVVLIVLPVALYFFKKDSADGRLLIWRSTLDMIVDKPIFGHGAGAFQAKYMFYQATYLNAHPDSQYAPLADNTLHPFNEYLLILSEYGIAGLGLVALMGFFLVRAYRRKPPPPLEGDRGEALAALMSLLALAAFSFFSYPFRYPFTWVMLFLNVAVIVRHCGLDHQYPYNQWCCFEKLRNKFVMTTRIAVFLLSTGLLAYTVMLTHAEISWKRLTGKSLAGQTLKVLPEYDKLYTWLGKDGLFLYNHAAELHKAKEYEKSVAVFERCARCYNDMDVQMLLADNYKELGKYTEAEQHLKLAAAMCPARFMPLYELVKLYEADSRENEALAMAKLIIDKDVKISSPTVTAIKNEMQRLIDEKGNPVNKNRTSDEPQNNETRQGETPHGATLPP